MASPETTKPREVIDLSGSYVEDGAETTGKQFAFILNAKNGNAIYLLASSDIEKMKWMQTLGGRLSVKKLGLKTEKSDKSLLDSPTGINNSEVKTNSSTELSTSLTVCLLFSFC